MNNIFKLFILSIILFVFSACVGSTPSLKPHEKAFDKEDVYIMYALRAEQVGSFANASDIFNTLYEKSQKKEYFYRSLKNDLAGSKNERVIQRVDEIQDDDIDDFELARLKIYSMIGMQRFEEAKELAIKLVDLSNDVDDYLLVSDVYVKLKKYDTALKYLESAYVKNYNEKLLDKMSIVLYVNLNRKKDAIAQLETHSRMHGCSELICSRLIGFYSNENNIEGLLSAYLRLYKINSTKEIGEKIVQIYVYSKDYMKLMDFLEKNSVNDELLLQIYINLKNYKKAYKLADKLYKSGGEIHYLGQSAIFEYESCEDPNDSKMHQSVIEKLKNVLNRTRDALYLNYLGYLLIDHDIDVKEGMKYVKEALELEPESAFYLDSLAWGYYKLGDCKEAYKIMKKVVTMAKGDNEEVQEHMKLIQECNKQKKGKK